MEKRKIKILVLSKQNKYSEKYISSLSEFFDVHFNSDPNNLNQTIKRLEPQWVFALHWGYKIEKSIYLNYNCVSFHTGNLPDDRGGSPIQNQIINGKLISMVNAIKIDEPIDSGDIYLSEQISLQGSIADIFELIIPICIDFTKKIILDGIKPKPQIGKSNTYKRKKNNELVLKSISSIYDQIRMLDGLDYPKSYINLGGYIFEFSRAKLDGENIIADVKISKK